MAKDTFHRAGGKARAKTMTPAQRSECARRAAHQRWHGKENPDPNLGSAFTGPNWPKCAVCRRASNAHDEKTNACPDLDSGGWASTSYLHPSLVPKLRADLVTAYSLALEAIAEMQAERMTWPVWAESKPAVGTWVLVIWLVPGKDYYAKHMGQVTHGGDCVGSMNITEPEKTRWYRLPDPTK